MNPPHFTFTRYANAFSKYGTDSALETIVGDVRTGAWAQQVAAVRQAIANGGKDAAKPLKKLLPGVTFSGRFNVRKTSGLIAHSGLICADLDALGDRLADVRADVIADPHTVAAFTSPSGDGLKVVLRCDPERHHLQSFLAARAHILATTGEAIDEACKNVDRLCFVSHDPNAFLANTPADVPVLPYPATVTEEAAGAGVTPEGFEDEAGLSTGDLAELLRSIPPRPDYDKWLRIASAVWSVTDEATGCALLTAWSPEEEPGEYAAKHPHRLADVGVGTLIY